MTPTEQEKREALAWADIQDPGGNGYIGMLAAAQRESVAEMEKAKKYWKEEHEESLNFQDRASEAESRLKTLEEENARMRSNYSMECYDHGHGYPCHICSAPTALKQEAE